MVFIRILGMVADEKISCVRCRSLEGNDFVMNLKTLSAIRTTKRVFMNRI